MVQRMANPCNREPRRSRSTRGRTSRFIGLLRTSAVRDAGPSAVLLAALNTQAASSQTTDWLARSLAIVGALLAAANTIFSLLTYRRGREHVAIDCYRRDLTGDELLREAERTAEGREAQRQMLQDRGEDPGSLDEPPFNVGKVDKRCIVVRVMNKSPSTVYVRRLRLFQRSGMSSAPLWILRVLRKLNLFAGDLWDVEIERPPDVRDAAIPSGNDCEWHLTSSRIELPPDPFAQWVFKKMRKIDWSRVGDAPILVRPPERQGFWDRPRYRPNRDEVHVQVDLASGHRFRSKVLLMAQPSG
jgi:hypothetical protein